MLYNNESYKTIEEYLKDENTTYQITPKGILYLAMLNAEIEFTEMQFNYIWLQFENNMKECGYVENEN